MKTSFAYDPSKKLAASIYVHVPKFSGRVDIDPTLIEPTSTEDLTIYEAVRHYRDNADIGTNERVEPDDAPKWTFLGIGWYHYANGSMLVVPLDQQKGIIRLKAAPGEPEPEPHHHEPEAPDHGHQVFRFYWWERSPMDAFAWLFRAPTPYHNDTPESPALIQSIREPAMMDVRRTSTGTLAFWSEDATGDDLESILGVAMDNIGMEGVVRSLANVLEERSGITMARKLRAVLAEFTTRKPATPAAEMAVTTGDDPPPTLDNPDIPKSETGTKERLERLRELRHSAVTLASANLEMGSDDLIELTNLEKWLIRTSSEGTAPGWPFARIQRYSDLLAIEVEYNAKGMCYPYGKELTELRAWRLGFLRNIPTAALTPAEAKELADLEERAAWAHFDKTPLKPGGAKSDEPPPTTKTPRKGKRSTRRG